MLKTKLNNAFNKVVADPSTVKAAALAASISTLLVPNFAFAANATMQGILNNLGGVIITVIALVGIIFTVKAVLQYMKGGEGGSIGKIVTTVLVVCLFIGLVLVLQNADDLSSMFQPIAKSGVESASNIAQDVVGQ